MRKNLADNLKSLGVEKVKTMGEKFDPEFHEAVMQVEGGQEGIVREEISSGYKRGNRLLKIPQVKVYKGN